MKNYKIFSYAGERSHTKSKTHVKSRFPTPLSSPFKKPTPISCHFPGSIVECVGQQAFGQNSCGKQCCATRAELIQ